MTRATFSIAMASLLMTFASGCDGCGHAKLQGVDAAGQPDASIAIAITPPAAASLGPITTDYLQKFFPKDGQGGYARVFAGAKVGYAEAKLQKDGKDIALVSITDAARMTIPNSRFDAATEKIGVVPVLKVGDKETSALVKERFQVKVFSTTLDHEARKAILASFDLNGLGT